VLERLYLLGLVVFEHLEFVGLQIEYRLAVPGRIGIDTNEIRLGAKDLRLLFLLLGGGRLRYGDGARCDGKRKEPENAARHRPPPFSQARLAGGNECMSETFIHSNAPSRNAYQRVNA
jgi:hypothetical protein